MTRARRIVLAWALGCVVLAAGGSWALLAVAKPGAGGGSGAPSRSDAAALPAPPPFERFVEAEQRPLFAATRRPPVATPAAPAPAPVSYRLEGVVLAGKQRHAILSDGIRTFRVGEGEAAGEWTVQRIEPGCVHLAAGARQLSVCKGAKPAK